jgi:hypothetical protein
MDEKISSELTDSFFKIPSALRLPIQNIGKCSGLMKIYPVMESPSQEEKNAFLLGSFMGKNDLSFGYNLDIDQATFHF